MADEALEGSAAGAAASESDAGGNGEAETIFCLVHGTFARHNRWTKPGSALCVTLESTGERVEFLRPQWSGGNSFGAREEARRSIVRELKESMLANPRARYFIVAHSHAGNAALAALQDETVSARVDGLICLSVPFLHIRSRRLGRQAERAWRFSMWWPTQLLLASALAMWRGWKPDSALPVALVWSCLTEWIGGFVRRNAERFKQRFTAQPVQPGKLLLIRAAGDEASMALASAQLLSWLLTSLWNFTALPLDWLAERRERLGSWVMRFLYLSVGVLILCTAILVIAFLAGMSKDAIDRITLAGEAIAVIALSPVGAGLALALGYSALGLLSIPLSAILGLLMLAFGPEAAMAALILEVTAEATPVGAFEVHTLPFVGAVDADSESGAADRPLSHSVYESPAACQIVAAWLRAQAAADLRRE